ncbi:hypothetical protein FH972_004454 [Carpinus fangiana]|uniref:Chloride channel protein n=1 Tax=Carpinus fangiana TaxID=176857 RepID=A0A5N6QL47_9ROSI|nr:hypothetical protein FH972_004454 [Carpinus fangiana]
MISNGGDFNGWIKNPLDYYGLEEIKQLISIGSCNNNLLFDEHKTQETLQTQYYRLTLTVDAGLFALLGAASFLGGTMRMTVSLCVILLELTNDLLMLPLVMLVLLISKTVADGFNKGVYDQIVKMKGLPYMEAHAEPYMRHLVASDVASGPLVTFSGVEKVGTILHALKITRHNGFPVIDEPPFSDAPELCGLVLRSHLLAGSGKGVKLEDLDIKEEELKMYVDLHPITNSSPYTVVETMSLAKAALLFREVGLRHLLVVPKTPGRPPIVGILTRHDFMPEHILGLYPHFHPHKFLALMELVMTKKT